MTYKNEDVIELADKLILICNWYKENNLDIKDFIFDLNELLKDVYNKLFKAS